MNPIAAGAVTPALSNSQSSSTGPGGWVAVAVV